MTAIYLLWFHRTTPERIKAWHVERLAEAETAKDAFAAAFHLRILLNAEPANADWTRRLRYAENGQPAAELASLPA